MMRDYTQPAPAVRPITPLPQLTQRGNPGPNPTSGCGRRGGWAGSVVSRLDIHYSCMPTARDL